jgi:hypothetical protein
VTNDWTRASTDALAIFEERVLLRFIVLSAIAAVVVGFSSKDGGLRIGAAGSRRWRVCYCPVYRAEPVCLGIWSGSFCSTAHSVGAWHGRDARRSSFGPKQWTHVA